MSFFRFIFILLVSFTSVPAIADFEIEESKHPIDVWYKEKMAAESASSAFIMREVTYQAQVRWEAEMNNAYKRLMSKLTKSEQAALRKAQLQWLKFSIAEGEVILKIISDRKGSMYQLSGTNRGMRLVRQRAFELISYEQEIEN